MPHLSARFPSSVQGIRDLVVYLNANHLLGYRIESIERLSVGRTQSPDLLVVLDLVQAPRDPPLASPPYRVAMAPKPTTGVVSWPITGAAYIPVGPTTFNAAVDVVTDDATAAPPTWKLYTLAMQPFDNDDFVLLLGESDIIIGPADETRNAGIALQVVTPSDTVYMGFGGTALGVGQVGAIMDPAHGRFMLMSRNGTLRRISLRNSTVANTTVAVQTDVNGVLVENIVTLVNGVAQVLTVNRAYSAAQTLSVGIRNPDEDNPITLTDFLITVELDHQ